MLGAGPAHLGKDGGGDHVARLQLVAEALAGVVQQDGALPARGLGDEEGAPGPLAPERGGVDLHVVHVLEQDPVLGSHAGSRPR